MDSKQHQIVDGQILDRDRMQQGYTMMDRKMSLAAVLLAVPRFIYSSILVAIVLLILLSIASSTIRAGSFLGPVLPPIRAILGTVSTICTIVLIVLALFAAWKIYRCISTAYHTEVMNKRSRQEAGLDNERKEIMLETARKKNEMQGALLEMVRQYPTLAQAAAARGYNVKFTMKGDLEISSPYSNVHTIQEERHTGMSGIAGPGAQGLLLGPARPSVTDLISATQQNSFTLPLGTSVNTGQFITADIRGKHIKVIGGTQMGKSTLIAELLKVLLSTHDTETVQLVILDLEDRTGRLFEDDPHIFRVQIGGKTIPLHARSIAQVTEYIHVLLLVMEQRYKLASQYGIAYVERMPRIVAYFEEFLYWKRIAPTQVEEETFKRALADITGLAIRALKVGIQLIVCSQVDYAIDRELLEAMAQFIGLNLALCVKPTAAQAAGYVSNELLKNNFEAKTPGRFVVETTGVNDIGLAAEIDVKAELAEIETGQDMGDYPPPQTGPFQIGAERLEAAASSAPSIPGGQGEQAQGRRVDTEPTPILKYQEKRQATYADAVEVWNEFGEMGRPRLQELLQARGLDCSDYRAGELLKSIKRRLTAEQA